MKPTIKERDDLASYPQVSLLIYQLLSVAQAGGMTEAKAKKIYHSCPTARHNLRRKSGLVLS